MNIVVTAQGSSKPSKQTRQSWNCVCCHIDDASSKDSVPVSTEAIGYGIIESLMSSDSFNPSPLHYLTTDDRFTGFLSDNLGALTQCITTLSRLDRRVLYEQKVLALFQEDSFEIYKSEQYYKADLNTIQAKVTNAKAEFDRAKVLFEDAKLAFITAFCHSFPENVEYRRCRVKGTCVATGLLSDIQNNKNGKHCSSTFVEPSYADVQILHLVPTIEFVNNLTVVSNVEIILPLEEIQAVLFTLASSSSSSSSTSSSSSSSSSSSNSTSSSSSASSSSSSSSS